MAQQIAVIVASTKAGGIGKDNTLPWRLPSDLKNFQKITKTTEDPEKMNCCIMGTRTYESVPAKFRPLPGRISIVLSKTRNLTEEGEKVISASSLSEAVLLAQTDKRVESIFVIGGATLINEAISKKWCSTIYLTEIDKDFECDTILDPIPSSYKIVSQSEDLKENDLTYRFLVLKLEDHSNK